MMQASTVDSFFWMCPEELAEVIAEQSREALAGDEDDHPPPSSGTLKRGREEAPTGATVMDSASDVDGECGKPSKVPRGDVSGTTWYAAPIESLMEEEEERRGSDVEEAVTLPLGSQLHCAFEEEARLAAARLTAQVMR